MNSKEIREQMIFAREEYIGLIKAELLGPGSEFDVPDAAHELISSSPLSRYSVGILYSQGNQVNHDSDEPMPLGDELDSNDNGAADGEVPVEEEASTADNRIHNAVFDETANESLDEEIGLSAQFMPSSMGLTFLVNGNTDIVHGTVSFATYRNAIISDCVIPFIPANPDSYSIPAEFSHKMVYDKELKAIRLLSAVNGKEIREIIEKDTIPESELPMLKKVAYRFVDFCRNGFVRVPHSVEFTLDFSANDYIDDNRELDGTSAKITALRTKISGGLWSLTIMFVNDFPEAPPKAIHCIFQPVLSIRSEQNEFVFMDSGPGANMGAMDNEERSLELLYRNKKVFGTGMGVSSNWDISSDGVGEIWTNFFPITEVPPMSFELPQSDTVSIKEFSMKYLSDLDKTDRVQKLSSLKKTIDLYYTWIESLKSAATELDPRYKSTATQNIAECEKACERMYSGIQTLAENDKAYAAFVLANRAMFMQRLHLKMQSDTSDIEHYPDDAEISSLLQNLNYYEADDNDCLWRPFQLAFLMMDINSIVDDNSPERDIVDLIWFPTGGGKTEAYLGLTAFTIFFRRLSYAKISSGTAVVMRYTLRLLAAQQFTRAATLICACEYIRADGEAKRHKYPAYPLGKEPVTIGLWIGGAHTPNNNIAGKDSAKEHFDELYKATQSNLRYVKERHNKFQVLKCPWCGTKLVKDAKDGKLIGKWGYALKDEKHFFLFCPHEDCDFTRRLPIQIVDEELYENPPTLLFGTVDKFAMLPWDGRTGRFFATSTENRAPELIIQDELHLISGSLGTIVGLYETAVDAICSQKGVRPKIIASTATIRRAKEQCSVLYNREVVQFPAPGLNAEDSFFARESEISYNDGIFGRKYVGIMPSGKTKAMTEIRVMAALLQKVYSMDLPDEIKDKLWTLTVYFNSLKDLGKASTLVDDDVKDFIIRTANRMFTSRRLIIDADELTSRVTTTELNETLDKLEKLEYSHANIENKRYASNILLATNMISVGIDVARLNVMLMVGQPKLTSEYIQASSRIGRSFPGIAFVQYDATKSRDRSHYEQFRAYHESFYRFVEPTGATPFSKPARERALHAVLTAITRHCAGLNTDEDAKNFDYDSLYELVSGIKKFIIDRVNSIHVRADSGLKDDLSDIEDEINIFFDTWRQLVSDAEESNIPFCFGRKYMVTPPATGEKRLLRQYHSGGRDLSIETLTSMRNVDIPVKGQIVIWEE